MRDSERYDKELLPTQADPGETAPLVEGSKYRQIFRQKLVYMLATFTLVYVGTEVRSLPARAVRLLVTD